MPSISAASVFCGTCECWLTVHHSEFEGLHRTLWGLTVWSALQMGRSIKSVFGSIIYYITTYFREILWGNSCLSEKVPKKEGPWPERVNCFVTTFWKVLEGDPELLRSWSLCLGEFCLKQRLPDSHPGFSTLPCSFPSLKCVLRICNGNQTKQFT